MPDQSKTASVGANRITRNADVKLKRGISNKIPQPHLQPEMQYLTTTHQQEITLLGVHAVSRDTIAIAVVELYYCSLLTERLW